MSFDKKQEAKRRADRLRSVYEAKRDPFGWFEALYKEAEKDPELIPWGHKDQGLKQDQVLQENQLRARFPLVEWLNRQSAERCRGRALDVGTGLGDHAALLARAGFDVTAFDVSATAIDWAAHRFRDLEINWQVANLLNPPKNWLAGFDLVCEVFTVQALKGEARRAAFQKLASFVAPGGHLLIVARGRLDDEPLDPPPWPLTPSELGIFKDLGFSEILFESLFDERVPPVRHFLVEYVRGDI